MPLHDAWAVDLNGPPGRTDADVRALVSRDRLNAMGPLVRSLFALRWQLGKLFGWDKGPDAAFKTVFESPRESVSEIHNATVHGFSVFALLDRPGGYRLYWAIYVKPVGPITGVYMKLIDPFRRFIIYPGILRAIRTAWSRREAA